MKKKVLFILTLMLMLSCIFVVSVNAAITTYDDAPVRTKIQVSTDDIIEFDDGFTCPTGYVWKDQTAVWDRNNFGSAMDFEYIKGKTGKSYTIDNVKGFDIPEGVTYIGLYAGVNLNNLKWITFPSSITGFGNAIFQNNTGLEECTFEFEEDHPIKKFPPYMFFGCKNLKAFSMPDSFTEIYDIAHFSGCNNLGAVYLSKNLTRWNSGGGGSRVATFDDNYKLYFVNEPFTYDNIPEKPEVYYFPANLEYMTNQCIFRGCKSLNNVLVFGEKITEAANEYFFQEGPANKIVFLGDMTTVSTRYWGNTTDIFFANENDIDLSCVSYSGDRNVVFCNAEGNTTHLAERTIAYEATCEADAYKTPYCFCGAEMAKEIIKGTALSHDYDYSKNEKAKLLSIEYTSYTEVGTKIVSCANCGENSNISAPALFTSLGYSTYEVGTASIVVGFIVNHNAINEYEVCTNKQIAYGTFAVSKDRLGNGDILASDGTANEGVIKSEMTYVKPKAFELKIRGFENALKDLKLAMGAYVSVTSDNVTTHSYIQFDKPSQGQKYYFASFNEIANILKEQ